MVNRESGQVMLITALVLSATILIVSIVAGTLTVNQLHQATNVSESAKAIFAAESGIEWYRYTATVDANYPQPTFSNGATLAVVVSPGSVKSIGFAGGSADNPQISRALELVRASSTPPVP